MIKSIHTALLVLVMIPIANAQDQFTPLFDGKTTAGWHSYGKTQACDAWKVENGSLHFDPTAKVNNQGGDLVTDKEYSDFHLKLDWKVAPKANSGIIFYVHENPIKYPNTYETGLEMQVLDNEGHPDGKIDKHRAGNLYDLVKGDTEPVKAVGEWNTAEIISNRGQLTFILNGVVVVKTTLWDKKWKELVSGSKFTAWKDFGTFKKGKIALQDHGDHVWYRNIMIKELY
ncbi:MULTISPECIES: 3-keto-disaccharide hydrolase [unclassified Flavobacterium]|uniref:3-keto-disaccharide hydrolase n=1 Tax=unclassified Flavobacterium TaxID=196869 RepID=UPI003F916550